MSNLKPPANGGKARTARKRPRKVVRPSSPDIYIDPLTNIERASNELWFRLGSLLEPIKADILGQLAKVTGLTADPDITPAELAVVLVNVIDGRNKLAEAATIAERIFRRHLGTGGKDGAR
jgi:hypothetical protein